MNKQLLIIEDDKKLNDGMKLALKADEHDFVREIRRTSLVPIILITVNNMELDIVTGLEAGANDYITKPFSLMVLRARAAVQLRGTHQNTRIFIQGKLRFDFDKMEFAKGERMIELSKTEQRLLRLLCDNKGATLKRSYLIDQVWKGDTEYVDEHALTVTIKRLRDKLELDPKNPKYIKTVYGMLVNGYDFDSYRQIFLASDFQIDQMTGTLSTANFKGISPKLQQTLNECPYSEAIGYVYYSPEHHGMERRSMFMVRF